MAFSKFGSDDQGTMLDNPVLNPNAKCYLGDGFEIDYAPSNNGSRFLVDLQSLNTSAVCS